MLVVHQTPRTQHTPYHQIGPLGRRSLALPLVCCGIFGDEASHNRGGNFDALNGPKPGVVYQATPALETTGIDERGQVGRVPRDGFVKRVPTPDDIIFNVYDVCSRGLPDSHG